jgi:fructose-bisphosphate aldolase class 1
VTTISGIAKTIRNLMTTPAMESTSESLLAAGKGILAADESYPTIKKRFAPIDLGSTEESRRNYRDMLFTTPGLNEFISGVILFDETMRQKTNDGVPMPEALAKQGIIPGIKVDMGAVAFAHFADEKVIAEATILCLLRVVPAAVPGIVFLSGGQSDEAATQRLNAIRRVNYVPWKLSFSFGRALQAPSLKIAKSDRG